MSLALELADVSHAYGKRQALVGVSAGLETGKVHVLLGPNGAGKTTLIGLIAGFLPLQSGSMHVCGLPLDAARRAGVIGFVFQEATLDPALSLSLNLWLHARLHGLSRSEARTKAANALERAGLAKEARTVASRLSGGQRRRAEIARAMMMDSQVLVLDEPTTGLDSPARHSLIEAIHAAAAAGTTVLLTTHLADEVWDEDQLLLLAQGRLAAFGTRKAVLDQLALPDLNAAIHQLAFQPVQAA